jgi:hypothetical protein
LWQRVRTLTIDAELSPKMRVLGTVGLSLTAFEIGFKIGSGLNAKFLRVGLPSPPEPKVGAATGTLNFASSGTYPSLNSNPLPEDGWLLQYEYASQFWTSVNVALGWNNACAYLTGPPVDFHVLGGTATGWCVGSASVESYWLPENELAAPGAIEAYTSQGYSVSAAAPTAPSRSTVESTIDTTLSNPDNDQVKQWFNYQVGSPGESDPTGVGADNPWESWTELIEHFKRHADKFDPPYEDLHEYWRDAAEIVEADELSCTRSSDGSQIYWDADRQAIVIVTDGKIQTYFPPDTGFQYWLDQCNS